MRDRGSLSTVPTRGISQRPSYTVDVALFTPRGKQLATLCVRSPDVRAQERWTLPFDGVGGGESLDAAAARIAAQVVGVTPAWIEQVAAWGDDLRHPTDAAVSVAFVAVVPAMHTERPSADHAWFGTSEPPGLAPRQQAMLDASLAALRTRIDYTPIAFRLLPSTFTLSELQQMYELLLGKRLHKASFRRALQAAFLVEATEEWRSEGRGRPAQLFRFHPRKRRGDRRGVRFDDMG